MKYLKKHILAFCFFSAAALFLLQSCEEVFVGNLPWKLDGDNVEFAVLASYENGDSGTKTVYAGERIFQSTTPKYERIEWEIGDSIRVYSPQARNSEKAPGRSPVYAAYGVTARNAGLTKPETDTATVKPQALAAPAGVTIQDPWDGLRWSDDKTLDHHFFGVYPSEEIKGLHPDGHVPAIAIDASNLATVTGVVPAVQTISSVSTKTNKKSTGVQWTVTEYEPDMFYAAMAAYTKMSYPKDASDRTVHLEFRPLVTTLRVELLAHDKDYNFNDEQHIPVIDNGTDNERFKYPLVKLELLKTDEHGGELKSLTGTYAVKLGAGSPKPTFDYLAAGTGGGVITIDLSTQTDHDGVAGGVSLYTSDQKRAAFTFLCVPCDQENLSLRLTFTNPETGKPVVRTMKIRERSGSGSDSDPYVWSWVKIDSMKKLYLDAISVYKQYVFEVSDMIALDRTFPAGMTYHDFDSLFYVKSYKRNQDGTDQYLPWKCIGYYWNTATDGSVPERTDANFKSGPPDWIELNKPNAPHVVRDNNYDATERQFSRWVDARVKAEIGARTFDWGLNRSQKMRNAIPVHYNSYIHYVPQPKYSSDDASRPGNCYIVSAPGWYKFPCSYGHFSIVTTNNYRNYYSCGPEGSGDVNIINNQYIRYDDNKISNAWLKEGDSVNPDENEHVPVKAELLWQDSPNLVKNVQINRNTYAPHDDPAIHRWNGNPFVYFYVDEITTGNAVLAVRNKGGQIVWSWHIWVIPPDCVATEEVSSRTAPSWNSAEDCDVMTLNLGYRPVETEDKKPRYCVVRLRQEESGIEAFVTIKQNGVQAHAAYNPYYQWGRKDPMVPSSVAIYKEDGTPTAFTKGKAEDYTIGKAIQNPMTFIETEDGSGRNWPGNKRYDNLWNYKIKTVGDFSDLKTGKTVYDPCPAGYKVPNRNAFAMFHGQPDVSPNQETPGTYTDANHGRQNYIYANDAETATDGFSFYTASTATQTLYFPLTGHLNRSFASDDAKYGQYWTSAPMVDSDKIIMAHSLDFLIDGQMRYVYPVRGINTGTVKALNQGNALSIRCVKDHSSPDYANRFGRDIGD